VCEMVLEPAVLGADGAGMTILDALRGGIRALNDRKRLLLLFYAITTIWALAAVAPVMALLFMSLGGSAWPEQMAANFDLQWIAELRAAGVAPFVAPVVTGSAVLAVATVAHLFLLGGAIQLFCAREQFSAAAFFQGCGKYFWRFVRLALISALLYLAVTI